MNNYIKLNEDRWNKVKNAYTEPLTHEELEEARHNPICFPACKTARRQAVNPLFHFITPASPSHTRNRKAGWRRTMRLWLLRRALRACIRLRWISASKNTVRKVNAAWKRCTVLRARITAVRSKRCWTDWRRNKWCKKVVWKPHNGFQTTFQFIFYVNGQGKIWWLII